MCGRFTLTQNPNGFCREWNLPQILDWKPRYNVSPGQFVQVHYFDPGSKQVTHQDMFWGLPNSMHPGSEAHRHINARIETAAEKPTFRNAIRERRCIILGDGFYEWGHVSGRVKQPFHVTSGLRALFAFSGIWEWDPSPTHLERRAFAILTRDANSTLASIHPRMPVLVRPEKIEDWLDPNLRDPSQIQAMTDAFTAEEVRLIPVGTQVNNARYDAEDCMTPQRAQKTLF
ncbi:MAG: SOS response-associated peptidase [Planctomycetales bacterium]